MSPTEEYVVYAAEAETGQRVTLGTEVKEFESLEVMELLLRLEEYFGTKLPNDAFKEIRTVGDIARLFSDAKVSSGTVV